MNNTTLGPSKYNKNIRFVPIVYQVKQTKLLSFKKTIKLVLYIIEASLQIN